MIEPGIIQEKPLFSISAFAGDSCFKNGEGTRRVTQRKLLLCDLAERHQGLTAAIAASYWEAARVCLDRHHNPPVEFELDNSGQKVKAATEWEVTDARTRSAWANEIDTTETGAYACALAAIELLEGLVAVHRAETKTGADYYVAPMNTSPEDLESCIRLEVSGLDRGTIPSIVRRLKDKLEQAKSGKSNLPAIATVVGFRERLIMLAPLQP